MMQIPKEKAKLVRMLFDGLKDMSISRRLYELLGGWLISRDNKDEKEKQLTEIFDDTFSYTIYPSRDAYKSFERFARRNGLAKAKTTARIPLRSRMAFKVAAVLVPAIILTGSVYLLVDQAVDPVEQDSATMVSVSAPASGERVEERVHTFNESGTHILPDRTEVTLAQGSELFRAEDFEGNRYVELKGKAHFNVTKAKNESDRFTVHTDHLDITVLGTQFNVHSPAGEAHSVIELYHGSVEVLAGGKTYRMKPTEHLRYDHITRETTLSTIPYGQLRYDEMPGLVFENTPISEVLQKVENDFGVHFIIDGNLNNDKVRGNLSFVTTLTELLDKLQILSGCFTYKIADNVITIKTNNI